MNFPKKFPLTKIQAFFVALLLITLSLIGIFIYNSYFKEYEFSVSVNGDFEKDNLYVKKVSWDKDGKIKLGEKIHFTIEIYHKFPVNFNESGAGSGKSEYYSGFPFPSRSMVQPENVYMADQTVKNYFDNGTILTINFTVNSKLPDDNLEILIYEELGCGIFDTNGNRTYVSVEISFKDYNLDAFIPCSTFLFSIITILIGILIVKRKILKDDSQNNLPHKKNKLHLFLFYINRIAIFLLIAFLLYWLAYFLLIAI